MLHERPSRTAPSRVSGARPREPHVGSRGLPTPAILATGPSACLPHDLIHRAVSGRAPLGRAGSQRTGSCRLRDPRHRKRFMGPQACQARRTTGSFRRTSSGAFARRKLPLTDPMCLVTCGRRRCRERLRACRGRLPMENVHGARAASTGGCRTSRALTNLI